MPLKYVWGMPEAVRIVGGIHGGLFLLYIGLATYFADKANWPSRKLMLAYVAAVVPLGPFIFDKKLFSAK
jgi:integral membrane protein